MLEGRLCCASLLLSTIHCLSAIITDSSLCWCSLFSPSLSFFPRFLSSLFLLTFFLLCLSHFSFHFSPTSISFYSVITVPCFNLPLYYFCSSFFYIYLSQSQISFLPRIWIIDIDHCSSLTFLILFFLSMIIILSFSFFIFLLSAFLTVLLSTSAIWNSICNAITLIIIIQFLDIHISSESFNSRPHLIFVETNVILFRISWQFGFKFAFSWFQMTTWKCFQIFQLKFVFQKL